MEKIYYRDLDLCYAVLELEEYVEKYGTYSFETHLADEDNYVIKYKFFDIYSGAESITIEGSESDKQDFSSHTLKDIFNILNEYCNVNADKEITVLGTEACTGWTFENKFLEFEIDHNTKTFIIKGSNSEF